MRDRRYPQRPRLRRVLVIAVPVLLIATLVTAAAPWAPAAANSATTIDFTHQKHIAAGVQCLFCHPQALNGPIATIPSVERCIGCHQNIQVGTVSGQNTIAQLTTAWEEQRPLSWPKIFDLPDFVIFNHRPHIAAGKSCETCHGNIGSMDMARVTRRINMGFCLNNCHRHQDEATRTRLMSCVTCHK